MYNGKYMYHLLYHLATRLVPTVWVALWFSKQTVINRSIFVMRMQCVYCDQGIENLCIMNCIMNAVRTLCSEGFNKQRTEGPNPWQTVRPSNIWCGLSDSLTCRILHTSDRCLDDTLPKGVWYSGLTWSWGGPSGRVKSSQFQFPPSPHAAVPVTAYSWCIHHICSELQCLKSIYFCSPLLSRRFP
jgi:hypothetical protein